MPTSNFNAAFSELYPNLETAQGQIASNTLSRLRGELSPETINAIQDQAARFGILSGMPGSALAGNTGRRLLGNTIEGLQSQGLQDYLNTLKAYSGTLMPTTGETIGAETSRYGTDVGAATSRYQADLAARTAANALGQQAYQFGLTFPESQRQFDVSQAGENQRYYSGLDQNYLNSYLSFLS